MGWLTLQTSEGEGFYDVLEEIKDGSDRATAIVAASFVEDHLTRMLKQRLVHAPEVANRCHNLEMWQTIKMTMRPANDEKQGRVVVQVGDAPDEEVAELPVIDVLEFGEVKTARERFIASCQFYIAVFSIIVSEHPSLRSPLI